MHTIRPGEVWRDRQGKPIRLRSGSVIRQERTWWWFGVHDGGDGVAHGIRAYASADLAVWDDRGIVLHAREVPGGRLGSPRVVVCPRTGGLILWFHLPLAMTAGVAVAPAPGRPFRFVHAIRHRGGISPEMNLFRDDDGSVWHLFGRTGQDALFASRLDRTGLRHAGEPLLIDNGGIHRTPVLMKWDGSYWLLATDGEDGHPGEPWLSVAPSLRGPWELVGNPCIGSEAQLAACFHARPSSILRLPGRPARYVLLADGARSPVWLPFDFRHGAPELRRQETGSLARRESDELREVS